MPAAYNINYETQIACYSGTALNSLAHSGTLLTGLFCSPIDNSTLLLVDSMFTAGAVVAATPTSGTQVQWWIQAAIRDTASSSDEWGSTTYTQAFATGKKNTEARLAGAMDVYDAGAYYLGPVSIASLFGGVMPRKWRCWVTQNTSLALTSGQAWYQGIGYNAV